MSLATPCCLLDNLVHDERDRIIRRLDRFLSSGHEMRRSNGTRRIRLVSKLDPDETMVGEFSTDTLLLKAMVKRSVRASVRMHRSIPTGPAEPRDVVQAATEALRLLRIASDPVHDHREVSEHAARLTSMSTAMLSRPPAWSALPSPWSDGGHHSSRGQAMRSRIAEVDFDPGVLARMRDVLPATYSISPMPNSFHATAEISTARIEDAPHADAMTVMREMASWGRPEAHPTSA